MKSAGFSSHFFWMSLFRFRYSFPSTIFQAVGSPSNFRPIAVPNAQKPPYCGAYLSGFAVNLSRFAALEAVLRAFVICRVLIIADHRLTVAEVGNNVIA